MKILYVNQYLSEIATTRLKAKELFSIALKSKVDIITFKDIQFASHSFLHEPLLQTSNSDIKLADCNETIGKLISLIESNKSRPNASVLEIRRAAPIKI